MKNRYVFLLLNFIVISSYGQPTAFFDSKTDTIYCPINRDFTYDFIVKSPKQEEYNGFKIKYSIVESKFEIPSSNLYISNENEFEISETSDIEKTFYIKMNLKSDAHKLLILKLMCIDTTGTNVELKNYNITKEIYIKPQIDSIFNKDGYEFWIFTGTNFDLLDGAKLKDLYFKGSYLLNLENINNKTSNWIYSTFGKNRYFSEVDSLNNISYKDLLQESSTIDTFAILKGKYNSIGETKTENIYFSIDYMYHFNNLSTIKSKTFFTLGINLALQKITKNFTNDIVSNDTIFKSVSSGVPTFIPPYIDYSFRRFNTDFSMGLFHILSTKKINVKMQARIGISILTYPYKIMISEKQQTELYKKNTRGYFSFRIDGTVLNPGLSLGFESYIRHKEIPLFNVSLTKVLDLEKIGNLFGKITPITY